MDLKRLLVFNIIRISEQMLALGFRGIQKFGLMKNPARISHVKNEVGVGSYSVCLVSCKTTFYYNL